jgi:peptidoglycan hydrolase-like protein with peptidoglycan-binding domain
MKTSADLLRVASGQVGYVEGGGSDGHSGNITKFGQAYGLNGYAWCSMFVWWVCYALGIDVRQRVSGSYAGAEQAMEGYKRNGWEVNGNSHAPSPGFVVFFHFNGEHAGANHTGFVVDHDAGGCHTIEGNTGSGDAGSQVNGGGVYRRYRPWSVIIGYGKVPGIAYSNAAGQPHAPAPSAGKSYPTLKKGMKGAQVARLQGLLHIHVDQVFGPATESAVKKFQSTHHLLVDGEAGPATLRVMGY